jgi:stalled ribosome rescue protein Dom34
VGFDQQAIHIWKVFSETVRKYKSTKLPRKWKNASKKDMYHFFEDLIDLLRPLMESGLKSVLLAEPQGSNWTTKFMEHTQKHHRWLLNSKGSTQVALGQIAGNAHNLSGARYLIEQEKIQNLIKKITSEAAYFLIKELEKSINSNNPNILVVYGLKEIENIIYEGGKKDNSVAEKVDYLLLTDKFLENHEDKNRVYRLIQIAENKGIITKVVFEESPAGKRIDQFGGVICFKMLGYY